MGATSEMEFEANSGVDWLPTTKPSNITPFSFGPEPTGLPQPHNSFTNQPTYGQPQFGNPSVQPTSTGNTLDAQPKPGNGGNMFGMQPNPAGNRGNIFGAHANPPGTNMFSAQPNPSGTNMFGAQPNPINLFGGQAPTGALQFGATPNSGSNSVHMPGVNAALAPNAGTHLGNQKMVFSVPG